MAHYESMLSQLELFQTPLINANVESNKTIAYFPIAPLANASQIDFLIPGGETYIDLSTLALKVRIRVKKEVNGVLQNIPAAEKKVSLCNLPLHSLFAQIDCYLNDTLVQSSNNCYPYLAYLGTLLNYNNDAKKSYKTLEGFYQDNFPEAAEAFHDDNKNASDNGILKRSKDIALSAPREYMGRLHIDACKVNKFLLNKVNVRLRLLKNSDDFLIISEESVNNKYHVVIEEAIIYVRHLNVNPDLQNAQNKLLLTQPALYDLTQTVIKSYTIAAGASDLVRSNLFLGKIPNRIIICLVNNTAFNGSSQENPFNFQHNNLSYLQLSVDEQNIPSQALTPDFPRNLYARSFSSLFNALNLMGDNTGNCINYDNYKNGNVIFMFDLTNDHQANSPNLSISKNGSMRLVLKFSTPLNVIQNIVLIGEFENQFLINHERQVTYITE